jgi:hypothetical protein
LACAGAPLCLLSLLPWRLGAIGGDPATGGQAPSLLLASPPVLRRGVVSSSSLAGRGGEGRRGGFTRFSTGCDVPRRAAVACAPLLARWLLRQALPLRLPPPSRGWCGECDGGSFDSVGFGVAPLSASSVQLLWCWKSYSLSSTSSVGHSRQASKIL